MRRRSLILLFIVFFNGFFCCCCCCWRCLVNVVNIYMDSYSPLHCDFGCVEVYVSGDLCGRFGISFFYYCYSFVSQIGY